MVTTDKVRTYRSGIQRYNCRPLSDISFPKIGVPTSHPIQEIAWCHGVLLAILATAGLLVRFCATGFLKYMTCACLVCLPVYRWADGTWLCSADSVGDHTTLPSSTESHWYCWRRLEYNNWTFLRAHSHGLLLHGVTTTTTATVCLSVPFGLLTRQQFKNVEKTKTGVQQGCSTVIGVSIFTSSGQR